MGRGRGTIEPDPIPPLLYNQIEERRTPEAPSRGVLLLSVLTLDGDLQSRAALSEETIEEYSEALQEGARFPPVVVFSEGRVYRLVDGWHRYEAHKRAGKEEIECLI